MICHFRRLVSQYCGLSVIVFIGMTLPVSGYAATIKGLTPVTQVEGIGEYRLENGLSVLLFPDPTKETVTVNVTYKVGSKNESYGETGMAHLLEHLMFKGSKKHPDIPAELSSHGASPNGSTWIDRTNYYETFAATEENVQWALTMEADRMVNSFIARKDLDSEMTVVRNEFEMTENNPFRVLMQRVMAASYLWHNNGKPSIGARSDIEKVSIERLQAFYRKYYQPDNAVLIIAGKFETDDLLNSINKTFGKIPKPKRDLEPLYTQEPAQDGERSVVLRRVGDIQWYAAGYHIPAGSHPDNAPLEVLTQILGDTPRGRLHKKLVEPHLAVATFAYPYELASPGVFFVGVQVAKDADLERAREAALAVVENVATNPITEEEVARAKQNMQKDFQLEFNSSESIAISLSESIGTGDWRLLFLNRDRVEQVTAADVQRVAQAYLTRNNRTEGRFIPTKESERVEIPEVDNLAASLDGYTGRKALAAGEAFDPSFANIGARTEVLQLSNGMKVALLPKKSRGESVILQLRMQYGNLASLTGMGDAGSGVGAMLLRGSSKYSREQLSDQLDAMKADIHLSGDTLSANATVETTKTNLIPTLELLAHVMREPKFDEKELAQLRQQSIAGLEASKQEPQAIISREMKRFFNQFEFGHPRYEPTLEEEIAGVKKLGVQDLVAFHKRFYGAKQVQIAVAGDFDPAAVKAALEHAFAGWNNDQPYQRVAFPYAPLAKVDKTIDTPDKENAAMVAMMVLPIGESDPDAVALSVGSYIYGGGFLNSRLAARLRQKEGLSYSVGAWTNLSPLDERGEFTAYAIFAPQNMAAVERGFVEELQRLLKDGITDKELDEARSGMLQDAKVERSEDRSLASILAINLFLKRDIQWYQNREERIKKLTVDDVNQALRRHLDPAQLSFVRAGDLSKVSGAKAPSKKAAESKANAETKTK